MNLKIINLENNLIDSFDNVLQIIEKVKLEKLLLSNNKIEMNEENRLLIEEINKKITFNLDYS